MYHFFLEKWGSEIASSHISPILFITTIYMLCFLWVNLRFWSLTCLGIWPRARQVPKKGLVSSLQTEKVGLAAKTICTCDILYLWNIHCGLGTVSTSGTSHHRPVPSNLSSITILMTLPTLSVTMLSTKRKIKQQNLDVLSGFYFLSFHPPSKCDFIRVSLNTKGHLSFKQKPKGLVLQKSQKA